MITPTLASIAAGLFAGALAIATLKDQPANSDLTLNIYPAHIKVISVVGQEIEVDEPVCLTDSNSYSPARPHAPARVQSTFGNLPTNATLGNPSTPSRLSVSDEPKDEAAGPETFRMPRLEAGFVFVRLTASETARALNDEHRRLTALIADWGNQETIQISGQRLTREQARRRLEPLEEETLVQLEFGAGAPRVQSQQAQHAAPAAAPFPFFPFVLTRLVRGGADGTDVLVTAHSISGAAGITHYVNLFNINGENCVIQLDDPSVQGDAIISVAPGDYVQISLDPAGTRQTTNKGPYAANASVRDLVRRLSAIGDKGVGLIP